MTLLDRIFGWFGIEPICDFHKSLDQCRLDVCEVWKWHMRKEERKESLVFWITWSFTATLFWCLFTKKSLMVTIPLGVAGIVTGVIGAIEQDRIDKVRRKREIEDLE